MYNSLNYNIYFQLTVIVVLGYHHHHHHTGKLRVFIPPQGTFIFFYIITTKGPCGHLSLIVGCIAMMYRRYDRVQGFPVAINRKHFSNKV